MGMGPQLDTCTQCGPNPPGGLGAGLRQTDRQTDGQTSSFIFKIIQNGLTIQMVAREVYII